MIFRLPLLFLLTLFAVSCSTGHKFDYPERFPSSAQASDYKKIEKAVTRVYESCHVSRRVAHKMLEHGKRPTYITGQGKKIQSFVLDNGRVVIIDLKSCKPENFQLNGDKIVDSRAASGQLYFRSARGRIYVMVPQAGHGEHSYKVFQVGTMGGNLFSNRYFYSMKRTYKGKQGILAWRSPSCTQDEVMKKNSSRLEMCQDDKAALKIIGKAVDSGRYLGEVRRDDHRYIARREIPVLPQREWKRTRFSEVTVQVLPTRPVECRQVQVEKEVSFLFIFSVSTTETQTICS
jgi:hypothetical protein